MTLSLSCYLVLFLSQIEVTSLVTTNRIKVVNGCNFSAVMIVKSQRGAAARGVVPQGLVSLLCPLKNNRSHRHKAIVHLMSQTSCVTNCIHSGVLVLMSCSITSISICWVILATSTLLEVFFGDCIMWS